MNKSNILLIPSFDSLSPNLSLIASTKSSDVIPSKEFNEQDYPVKK